MNRATSLRALILCDLVGPFGGTESYWSRVVPELQKSGADITIQARRVDDSDAFGVRAQRVVWGNDDEAPIESAAEVVRATVASHKPDVVLVSNVFDIGVIVAARAAPRMVVRVHDHRMFCPQGDRYFPHFQAPCDRPMGNVCLANAVARGCAAGLSMKTVRLLRAREALRDAIMMADAVVVSSHYMARICIENGIDPNRVAIIPPPWRAGSAASPHLALPKERRVLFSGRLVPNKGLGSLINAVSNIPAERRPQIDVAGTPTREVPRLVALARRKNVTLNVLGWLDGAQMSEAIDRARVIAVPSLSPEPFGLTGIEAFVRGRPVVAYASGGINEWIGRGGIIVPPGDEIKLAAAIDDVLEDSRWPLFARLAHRQAANYTVAKHVSRLLEVCGVSGVRDNELTLPSEYA